MIRENLTKQDFEQMEHRRLASLMAGMMEGFGRIQTALAEETQLHATVRAQQQAIEELTSGAQTLNKALAAASANAVDDSEFFRAALEEIRSGLEDVELDCLTKLHLITSLVDASLGGHTNISLDAEAEAEAENNEVATDTSEAADDADTQDS